MASRGGAENAMRIIDDILVSHCVPPERMDQLWAEGWRHFGPVFFRYSMTSRGAAVVRVLPLRIELERFQPSKSQRRGLRRNADLVLQVQPTGLDDERRRLFDLHKLRFKENVPASLEDFIGLEPASVPCENVEIGLYAAGRLLAVSFLDVGR